MLEFKIGRKQGSLHTCYITQTMNRTPLSVQQFLLAKNKNCKSENISNLFTWYEL